jgi:anion-transporting  ArsA/GET3 family ATPase
MTTLIELTAEQRLDVDALLADPSIRIVVCCGSGGVGKTTTAAALALRAAERHGRRTVVLTIDPAHRLAQSLGLTEPDNSPAGRLTSPDARPGRFHQQRSRSSGRTARHDADMKRTFDEAVAGTRPEAGREIYVNPFYQAMSSTARAPRRHGYGEVEPAARTRRLDPIVVDTPPSRSALDFLDAPARLGRFLDGRMLRLVLAPARGGRSVFSLVTASFGLLSKLMDKILGAQLITDLSGFVGALDNMFGGFRERSEQTYRVLQNPETAFLVVASPEPDAIREADYFAGRLESEKMPLAGLVLNRVHEIAAPGISNEQAAAAAERIRAEHPVAADTLLVHARLMTQAARERQVTSHFTDAHPSVPMAIVAAQPVDVHDIDGLRKMGVSLGTA